MNYLEFSNLIFESFNLLVLSLFACLLIYIPIIRKRNIALFSPFILVFYNSITASAIFLFLTITKIVDFSDFLYYLAAEMLFYYGFCTKLPPLKIRKEISRKIYFLDESFSYVFFISIFLLFLFNKILFYKIIGIPILFDSRNEVFTKGGGSGIIIRADTIFSCIITYYATYFCFIKQKHKIFNSFVFIIYIITLVLSANKSGVIVFFCNVYAVLLLFSNYKKELLMKFNKKNKLLIFFSVIFLFLGFVIQYRGNSLVDIVGKLFFRLLAQGDAIFLGFPKQLYKKVTQDSFCSVFFSDLLVTFRITPYSFAPKSIGQVLFSLATGNDYDSGSVTPHQLLGLIEFGKFGGMCFSFYLGVLMNFLHSNYKLTSNHILNLVKYFLFINAPFLNYAFFAFNVSITSFILFTIPILFIFVIFKYLKSDIEM